MSTDRAQIHRLVDQLSPEQFVEAEAYLRHLLSDLDDEELTAEELAEVLEGESQIARGDFVTFEELKRRLPR